jgi:hypothetical protein
VRLIRRIRPVAADGRRVYFIFRLALAMLAVVAAPRSAFSQTAGSTPVATVRVVVDGTSIWSAPYVPSMVMTTVKSGTLLDVLAQQTIWYRVKLPNDDTRSGYILIRQVELVSGTIPNTSAVAGAAQRPRAPSSARSRLPQRGFVFAGLGYQSLVLNFENKVPFTEFVEEGTRMTTYEPARTGQVDVGAGVGVGGGIFISGAIVRFTGSSDAKVEAQIPHPLYFDQPRTVTGVVTDLPQEETAIHFQFAGLVPVTRRAHLAFGLGPTIFNVKQTLVTGITYEQQYPYDSATFQSATTEFLSKTQVGGNVQGDFIFQLHGHVGLDAMARFSRGVLTFTTSDGTQLKVAAGGLQISAGIRAEF